MDKKDKKVTASEVAGELRKAARMFEVFKHAAAAADILSKSEAVERKIKDNIKKLEQERDTLDAQCDTITEKIAFTENDLITLSNKIDSASKHYNSITNGAKVKASIEAAKIVDAAEDRLKNITKEISIARDKKSALYEDIQHAEQSLSNMTNRIEEVKSNAIKALG